MTPTAHRVLDTPTGPFAIWLAEDHTVRTGWLAEDEAQQWGGSAGQSPLLDDLAFRLTRYFAGDPVDFSDVPLPHGSDFFRACWQACRQIPSGRTISYGQLAAKAGSIAEAPDRQASGGGISGGGGRDIPARAAGQAMRHNPLPIIIPCHRVVAADGSLHGFSGDTDPRSRSLASKRWLLEMECAEIATDLFTAPGSHPGSHPARHPRN